MLWLVLVFLLAWFLHLKILAPLNYWEKKKVPHVKPWPIFGNLAEVIFRRKTFAISGQELYNKFGDKRYYGVYQFQTPTLILRDPDLIKQICVKDFDAFPDHPEFLPKTTDTFFNKNLFAMTGKDWHDMRTVLSPAFTSSKMKMMFVLMNECAHEFVDWMDKKGPTTLEMKDTFLRYTNNVIASTAFGIKVNALTNPDDEFFKLGKDAFNFEGLRVLKFFGSSLSPTLMKMLNVTFFSEHAKSFFMQIIKDTIRQREEAGLVRLDMIHLLREAQKGRLKNEEGDETYGSAEDINRKMLIGDEDFAAQAMVFFFGGFDTVGSLLRHMAYALAVNPDVQDKLVQEIIKTKTECNGEVTYQALQEMKYMDMVASETMRMWPPLVFLTRLLVRHFTIEPKLPGEEPLHLDPGTHIWIHTYALQHDPNYFPEPEKFDPERFSEENAHKLVPYTYLPFGAGPRICVAVRYAMVKAKILMFRLLDKFELVPTEKTQIPLVISKNYMHIHTDAGYWLGIKPRARI